jgi:CubicO group peptidase (beta-lactamase class C family)
MTRLDRRRLLTILGAGFMTTRAGSATAAGDFQQRLADAERSGHVSGLHALVVSKGATLLFEHYGKGVDEDISRNTGGLITFGPEVLHDLRSVSKSVVGLAYGVALADGGTGLKLPAYCRRVLFDPMGFGPSEWAVGTDGEPRAASGCRLIPRDLLKVGQLALAGGAWQGKQVVPADWVKRITTPTIAIEGPRSYGYHWYIYDNMVDGRWQYWFDGIGWGGQKLYVFPGADLVVAMTCGNYSKSGLEQNRVNIAVLNEVVFPSLG